MGFVVGLFIWLVVDVAFVCWLGGCVCGFWVLRLRLMDFGCCLVYLF